MFAERDEHLRLSDGTRLIARIWSPAGSGPWPALLMRQPYGRCIASTVTLAHPRWWADHGYLVVVQDVRGQGDSEGVFTGFSQEAHDTAETHAWVRALPECNGRIGCYGFSYQGLTQLLAPPGSPPPDCMAPAMAGLDERLHWSSEGGAHWWHLGLGWGLQLAAQQARRRGDHDGWCEIRHSLENGDYLRTGPDLLRRHDPNGMAWTWLQLNPKNATGWHRHAVLDSWLKQPMLLLGGWWDPHLMGLLDLDQRSRQAGGCPELHVGPATHLQWWPEAQQLLLDFFNRNLKGDSIAPPHLQRLWDLGNNSWCCPSLTSCGPWSLAGTALACHDTSNGRLEQGGAGAGSVVIVHDPWRAVPAEGGHLSPTAGPRDRSNLDQRTDVATFTTRPLKSRQIIEGRPELRISVSADQPGFDLCVALSRRPARSSTVEQLSTGVLRTMGEGARVQRERQVKLQPLRATLEEGDQLRLSIAPAAWPAIGVNPGTPDHPAGAPGPNHRVVTMTLNLAGSELSLIPLNSGRLHGDPDSEP